MFNQMENFVVKIGKNNLFDFANDKTARNLFWSN